MAATRRSIFGVGFNTTSSTTISAGAPTGTDYPQVGDYVVVMATFDNQSSTTPTVTGMSCTGGGGAVGAFTIANMGAAAVATALGSVRVAIGYAQVTTAFTSAPSVSATLSVATAVRTIGWTAVTGAANPAFYGSGTAGFTGAFSYTGAVTAPDTLGIFNVGTEANAAPSVTSGTVVGSVNSATGGSAANVALSIVQSAADIAGTVSDGGVIGLLFEDKIPKTVASTTADYGETAWSGTGTSKLASSVSWQAGDRILVLGMSAGSTTTLSTPTVSGLTFAAKGANPTGSGSQCLGYAWEATAASSGSGQVQGNASGTADSWGIGVWVCRGCDGFGNRASDASAAKTVSLLRGDDHSRVAEVIGDWSAGAITSHAWTPTGQTEREATQDGSNYTAFAAEWGDQGSAGTTSYGITGTSSSGAHTKVAVEILGTVSSLTQVTSSRATSWAVLAQVSSSRATSWAVLAQVSSTRGTSWATLAPVTSSRSTSWAVLAQVSSSRATLWAVLSSLTQVTSSRATSWAVRAQVSSTRSTSWAVLAQVSSSRATSWAALARVTSTRSTSWAVLAQVSSSRSTLWAVLTSLAQVTSSRATSWAVRAQVTSSRATSWAVLASVTSTRSTSWAVLLRVTSTRSTSWRVLAQVTSSRATLWAVLGTLAQVTSSRSTSWAVFARVSSSRSTSWAVLARVSASRSTSWAVLLRVSSSRSTSWGVLASVTSSRSTSWAVAPAGEPDLPPPWRVMAVRGESRTLSLHGEARTLAVAGESRTLRVPAESRTLIPEPTE